MNDATAQGAAFSPGMALLFLILFLGVAYWGFSGYRRRRKEDQRPKNDEGGDSDASGEG